jgi:hypothetical protein
LVNDDDGSYVELLRWAKARSALLS